MPGLPFLPFAVLGGGHGGQRLLDLRQKRGEAGGRAIRRARGSRALKEEEERNSVKELLRTSEIELCLGRQLSSAMLVAHGELAHRVGQDAPEIRASNMASSFRRSGSATI